MIQGYNHFVPAETAKLEDVSAFMKNYLNAYVHDD